MSLPKKINNTILATGRRKTSVARVKLVKGKGDIIINKKPINEYFPAGNYVMIVRQPLESIEFKNDYDIIVNVYGGGLTGQAGAVRHSIARAFSALDDNYHKILSKTSYLTRDSRMVERKKYGQKKARRRFQFSKR
ncbi:MAG: 30S ribosomal protein S9 [Spirochaetes bacterium]|nr:30S ribosomal protein S9 [Spirochaetota bacterium]